MTIDSENTPYSYRELFYDERNYYKIFDELINFNRKVNEKYNLFKNEVCIFFIFYPMAEEYFLDEKYAPEFFEFLKTLGIDKAVTDKCQKEIENYIKTL